MTQKCLTIKEIRDIIYIRQHGRCIACSKVITSAQAHLHEKIFRSQGGSVSLTNSEILCADCHIGENGVHGKRKPQFNKKGLDKGLQ